MLWFILKIVFFVILGILIRGTLPRYRIDQLTSLHWKTLIFLYIIFIINILILIYYFTL